MLKIDWSEIWDKKGIPFSSDGMIRRIVVNS